MRNPRKNRFRLTSRRRQFGREVKPTDTILAVEHDASLYERVRTVAGAAPSHPAKAVWDALVAAFASRNIISKTRQRELGEHVLRMILVTQPKRATIAAASVDWAGQNPDDAPLLSELVHEVQQVSAARIRKAEGGP